MYKVLKMFHDLQDNNYYYEVGKPYPREGVTVLPSRIKELATNENRIGEPLIVEVEEENIKTESKAKRKNSKKSEKE